MSGKNRICIIYNPVAQGGKSKRFFRHRELFNDHTVFKPTDAPNAASRLAAGAIEEGFETIVAAGGDGTLNEVLNGFADVQDGFKRARLAFLPLGTVNVFAREIGLPRKLLKDWKVIEQGRETMADLGCAIYQSEGIEKTRYFIQLGGAGLDARAIELVRWEDKQRLLQLAYVFAGFKAIREPKPEIVCKAENNSYRGKLVLFGNGRFYGGSLPIFPKASLKNGLLDIRVFHQATLGHLLWFGMRSLLSPNASSPKWITSLQTKSFSLSSDCRTSFELEGDLIGRLPISVRCIPSAVRIVVP